MKDGTAIVLGGMAEAYLHRNRFQEAEVLLKTIYQNVRWHFDVIWNSRNWGYESVEVLLEEEEERYRSDVNSDREDARRQARLDQFRNLLKSYAVFYRVMGDPVRAGQLDEKADALPLFVRPRPKPPAPPAPTAVPTPPTIVRKVDNNPYVACLLPDEDKPVHHKRWTCKTMGGQEVPE